MGSSTKRSGIQCFKCGGRDHVIKECPNNRVIIVNDQGELIQLVKRKLRRKC
jgi:hypothetical protein